MISAKGSHMGSYWQLHGFRLSKQTFSLPFCKLSLAFPLANNIMMGKLALSYSRVIDLHDLWWFIKGQWIDFISFKMWTYSNNFYFLPSSERIVDGTWKSGLFFLMKIRGKGCLHRSCNLHLQRELDHSLVEYEI